MLKTPADFQALTELPSGEKNAEKAAENCAAGINQLIRLVFRGNEVLAADDGALPEPVTLDAWNASVSAQHAVGQFGGQTFSVQSVEKSQQPPHGYNFRALRTLWNIWPDAQVAIAGRAFQIQDWARTHQFCGACSTPTQRLPGERGIKCPNCGYSAYPRISPAMMVLITRGDEILLARNVAFPPNRYSALAGFLEVGESIEEAVHREVFEEVGLKVKDLRYFASQSWPFPHSLMIGFTAEYAGGEIVTQPNEIADARWFGAGDELPDLPPRLSIARSLVDSVISKWVR